MRILALLIAALLSAPAFGAVAFNAFGTSGYAPGSGTTTVAVTATGTNLACVLVVWYRSGADTSPTCGGNAMGSPISSVTFTNVYTATVDTYYYAGAGLSAGTVTGTISSTVETDLDVIIFNGAKQVSTPDAIASLVSGTFSSPGGTCGAYYCFGIPITTVANNALVLGVYNATSVLAGSPSYNGTYIGSDTLSIFFWYSTVNVTPAGSYSLYGQATANYSVDANGLSIAPPTPIASAGPSSSLSVAAQ